MSRTVALAGEGVAQRNKESTTSSGVLYKDAEGGTEHSLTLLLVTSVTKRGI